MPLSIHSSILDPFKANLKSEIKPVLTQFEKMFTAKL